MNNIKLTLQYDGSAYIGWQRQALEHGRSIQQVMEEGLARVLGEPVLIHGAGRTDSGVHAYAQTASFLCPVTIPVENLPRALNNILPLDIRVTAAKEMPYEFHARLSATGKRYRYTLATDTPDIFNYRWYWQLEKLPDADAMREAAVHLVGEHDFSHFTLSNTTAINFVRNLRTLRIYEPQPQDLPYPLKHALVIEAAANGFLYRMMRLITCRLLAVGRGLLQPAAMVDFLQGQPPLLLPPAPPQGLMLMEVYY